MYETLTDRAIIGVSGNDAINFLHNLTTNDIKQYDYCYNYALSNQGRYLFDFFVFKVSSTNLLVDININQVELFKSHLSRYKLRAKIEIADLNDTYQVLYSKEKLEAYAMMSIRDPRYNKLGFRSIIAKEYTHYLPTQMAEVQQLYLRDKYNLAIVDGYEDLIYDRSVPVEYGGEELNAVSYTKGCYIGQEIISRAKYQGVVRKKIFKLFGEINIANILKNDEIVINNTKIGVLCSNYQNMGIALIRLDNYVSLQNGIATIKNIPVSLSIPDWRL
ncbi:YgfZ/GcvT domain-containing protein [Candidatus Tisiphia endosymbiont of Nemotelus uliginosus]|uniref:CAF17-like 4Fe-4S cluster assembly/insertion protein YgfZ n=1 Tax=Candidatus Tisiphia endosymbiont of Nemotelus uliginosus TaxID=3077926 RepID=UPI0035C8D4C0